MDKLRSGHCLEDVTEVNCMELSVEVWTGLPLFEVASDIRLPECGHELPGSFQGEFLDRPNRRLLLKMDSVPLS